MNKERPDQSYPLTLEAVTHHAIDTLLRDGRHVPTLIVEGSQTGVLIQIGDIPPTHEERMEQMFTLGFSLARYEAIGKLNQVFLIMEGWMSIAESGELLQQPPPQDPLRREVLIIASYAPDEKSVEGKLIEMLRDDKQQLRELKPVTELSGGDSRMESPLLVAFAHGFMRGLT